MVVVVVDISTINQNQKLTQHPHELFMKFLI